MRRPGGIDWARIRDRAAAAPGMAIAGIFVGVSGMMSVSFGYQLGEPSGNALIFAAVAIGIEGFADLAVPLFWRRLRLLGKAALILFFGLCLLYKLTAANRFPEKGQMVLARRFQLEEIARMYQLPPVFLQDLTKGTLANTEQQDLHFVKHTLAQWIKAWEQELNLKLFGPRKRDRFVEFNVDGLLRGDFKTRMEGYAKAIQNAINTPDEVRGMENWPAMGGDAAKLHVQGATVPLGEQLQRGGGAVPPPPANDLAEDENDEG